MADEPTNQSWTAALEAYDDIPAFRAESRFVGMADALAAARRALAAL